MAVNLAVKYHPQLVKKFTAESFLAGRTNQSYDFNGVKSITVTSIVTIATGAYDRTASSNRYGTPTELQDTIQEMTMTQDRSFSFIIDKGNNSDQMNIKKAGEALDEQLKEVNIPEMDAYAFSVFFKKAGKIAGISAPSASTIIGLMADAIKWMVNNRIGKDNLTFFIGATYYNILRLSTEVIAIDPMAEKSLGKGIVAHFMGVPIAELPDDLIPTNAFFMLAHRTPMVYAMKFKTLKINLNPQGIDGVLVEGRHYYDAWVLGQKANGIYSAVNSSYVQATPTITPTGASHAITSASATSILYTLDGSDPRYSKTAIVYSGAVTLTSGQTIKACALRTTAGWFPSAVASATYTA